MPPNLKKKIAGNTEKWLKNIARKPWPSGTVAINFGIFEWEETGFETYVAFCKTFDENSRDWPCDELEKVKYRYAKTPNNKGKLEWDEFEKIVGSVFVKWVRTMKNTDKFKGVRGIAHGFDSGDLTIIYKNDVF
jgi:hypothetical protein